MKPLRELTNVQKAKLLHNLFPEEIPAFLTHLKTMSNVVGDTKKDIAAFWGEEQFSLDYWLESCANAQNKLRGHEKEMVRSSEYFAEQLFEGYSAIFTVHALTVYVIEDRYSDPKFKQAVSLLFN